MHLFPFLQWWPKVTKATMRADIQAGIIGALVVMPQGVAFAAIAGMPPQYGLFTAMIPTIIAALFGSSWLLVSGPATAASLVLFSSLSLLAPPETPAYIQLAITTTFMAGLIQMSLGLARFGSLVNFISHSVVIGFTAGAGLHIIASQAKHFFGVDYPHADHFIDTVHSLAQNIHDVDPFAVLIGMVTILTSILVKRYWPNLPNLIFSVITGSTSYFLLLTFLGPDTVSVSTVGALPATLPPLAAPDLTLENIKVLAPTALAMALFSLTEAISIARALAEKTGQELDGNQEFIGQGLSNIIGCFFSGYVATGSFNRSAINYEAGAKTPLSAIFAGILLIPALFFLAPLTSYLPKASLAGLLFVVGYRLIDFEYINRVVRTSGSEMTILVSTFLATLFLEMQFAIILGIMMSVTIYLNRTSHPKVSPRVPNPRLKTRAFVTDPHLPECPQLKILRIDGSLYFGAVHHTRHMVHKHHKQPSQKHLLLICSGINFMDMSGEDFLLDIAKECSSRDGALYFCDMKKSICSHCSMEEFHEGVGKDSIFSTKNDAINQIFKRLDSNICKSCTKRIFEECRSIAFEEGEEQEKDACKKD